MFTLIFLLFLWAPFVLARYLRVQNARRSPPAYVAGRAIPSLGVHADREDEPTWSAQDDRQLTRLLKRSAH